MFTTCAEQVGLSGRASRTLQEVVQLFASVTVTVYVFADNPVIAWFVNPLLHKYV